jgi:hypothetical protein
LHKGPDSSLSLLVKRKGFDGALYVSNFGAYSWTYIAGYRELLNLWALAEKFTLQEATEFIKGLYLKAISEVPVAWQNPFENRKGADWARCHPSQIELASKGGPLRFDRACQAIKALELMLKFSSNSVLKKLDLYEYISLRPAIYVLRGLSPAAKTWLGTDGNNQISLLKELCGRDDDVMRAKARSFLDEVSGGFAATGQNADLILCHMREHDRRLAQGVTVAQMSHRGDDERFRRDRMKLAKTCSTTELPFISPPRELEELWKRMRATVNNLPQSIGA